MSRPPQEPKTASAVTREFFELLDRSGMSMARAAARGGIHINSLMYWRSGRSGATLFNMESILKGMGYELVIQPIQKDKPGKELTQ